MRGMLDDIFKGIGGKVASQQKIKSQVLLQRQKYGISGSMRKPSTNQHIAGRHARKRNSKMALDQAMAKRQTEIGRNTVIGGSAAAIGLSALGRDQNISAYNPMPAPRGTGRYA